MGGKSSDEQTVRNEPWGGVQGPLKDLYGMTGQALGNRLPYYPNQTYPNMTPLQEAGMFGNLDYAQNYYSPASMGYQQSLANYMDAPLNIASNPAVQSMMAANQQNATDWLTQKALPSITTGSVAAGQLGGSRQGIAQGQAIGDATKALTQANAQTMLGALDPMTRLAGYASNAMPGALQMGFTPGDLAMQYGGNYQGMTQKGIDEAMNRYYYPEQSLWDKLGTASNIYSGSGVYGTRNTDGPGSDPMSDLLGLGSLGLGAYNAGLFGGTAAAGTALGGGLVAGTAGGVSASSLLPFFAATSDRRLKKNIKPLGEDRGYQWYEFEYKDEQYGKGKFIGVMADEVEKINPDAVITMGNGYKAVIYGAL